MPEQREYKGYNGDLILTDTRVIIKRGAKGFLLGGGMLRGDKTIPYAGIVAVQFRKAGMTAGYLQLTLKGGSESKGGLFQSTTDENSVNFHSNKNKDFEEAKEVIEKHISGAPLKGLSHLDELERFAELRDKGILTQEEFDSKKKSILGGDNSSEIIEEKKDGLTQTPKMNGQGVNSLPAKNNPLKKNRRVGLIVAGVIFFPIAIPGYLIWYIWKKKKLKPQVRIAVTILLAAFGIVVSIAAYSPEKEPVIVITEPADGIEVQAKSITVKGSVNPSNSTLTINGVGVGNTRGKFSREVALDQEKTIVYIVADNGKKRATKSITVKRIFTEEEKIEYEKKKEAEERARKEALAKAAEKRIGEVKQQIQRELDALKKPFDNSIYRGSKEVLMMETVLFGLWANMIEEHKNNPDPGVKSMVNELKRKVSQLQVKEFPLMRKEYVGIIGKVIWENNVEVTVSGAGNKTIEFTGALFANNKNVTEAEQAIRDALKLFRFTRANYKWFKYDDEYTYYKIESESDSAVVKIESK
jgi:hypothetical protein